MARANNSPTNWHEGLTTADKSDMLAVFEDFRKLPPVHKDDVKEINQRLEVYFRACSDSGILPTVESMGLILGVSRQSMWKWQQQECEAGQVISRAKELINAMIATATMQGRTNPVYAIWMQKNHFNYSDTQTLEIANVTDKKPLSASELPKLKAIQTSENLPRLEPDNLANNYPIMENLMENAKDNT
ncbi:MAG: terminase small subunit [Lachnospiraceae bacterium]